jgi:hypothetical protein
MRTQMTSVWQLAARLLVLLLKDTELCWWWRPTAHLERYRMICSLVKRSQIGGSKK